MVATQTVYYPGARVTVPRSKIAVAAVAIAAIFGLSVGAVSLTPVVVDAIDADPIAGTAIPDLDALVANTTTESWIADPTFRNHHPVQSDESAYPGVESAAETIRPGFAIGQNLPDGESSRTCTVGFVGVLPSGVEFAVTAGHCVASRGKPVHGMDTGAKIGYYRVWQTEAEVGLKGDASGFAVLELAPQMAVSMSAASAVKFNGTDKAEVGDTVCKLGITTGRSCGTVAFEGPRQLVITGMGVSEGDSGGPVFRENSDGTVTLVGLLQGYDTNTKGERAAIANPIVNVVQALKSSYDPAAAVLR